VTASGAELGAHPVKAAEIATAAVSVALSQTESAKDLHSLRVAARPWWSVSLMQKALKDDLVSEQYCTDTAQSARLGCRRRLLQARRTDISATRR
jgi:hypothetical protein